MGLYEYLKIFDEKCTGRLGCGHRRALVNGKFIQRKQSLTLLSLEGIHIALILQILIPHPLISLTVDMKLLIPRLLA
jgi:hypothetical protein